jgi:hypothetical protein
MPISSLLSNAGRVAAIVLVGLLAGSMLVVWRGYDLAGYTAATYLEVHKLAIAGLNVLLPAMGFVSIALVVTLAVGARHDRRRLASYAAAAALLALAGIVTRFANQPINDLVMNWTTLPDGWEQIRDSWRNWHLLRFAFTLAGFVVLVVTALNDRAA